MSKILNIKDTFNKISSGCLVLNIVLLGLAAPAIAELKAESNTDKSDFGLPTHRRDGGSRGSRDNCLANAQNQNLMALIPENTVGINASASPELFFYVPEVNREKTLEFVLRNEQDELMYETFISTKGDGIVSIEIPDRVRSNLLESEQNYHWYLSMICDRQQRSRDIVVEGWMRQGTIDTATQKQLDNANSIEQAEVYNERGFWYDALSVLAEDKDAIAEQPMVREKWTEMLNSVGLEELATKPFVDSELVDVAR